MKSYIWLTSAILLVAPFCDAYSASETNAQAEPKQENKAVEEQHVAIPAELHAKVAINFSKDRDEPLHNGGIKGLKIETDGTLSCALELGFVLDECGPKNFGECATITGVTRCSYKTRKLEKVLTNNIQWQVVSGDAQAKPNKNPYNMAGCSRYTDNAHLSSCLARELKEGNLAMDVNVENGEMKITGGISGCQGCKFSPAQ